MERYSRTTGSKTGKHKRKQPALCSSGARGEEEELGRWAEWDGDEPAARTAETLPL
jgi:hypothetical protein